MPNKLTRQLTTGAVIAALYVALTYFSRLLGLADGSIQFRLSEVLTVLPAFTPAAVPGLTIGCLIANIGSPFGIIDILSGAAATFAAAVCTRALRRVTYHGHPVLSPLPPIILNGLIVGTVVTIMNDAGKLIPQQFTLPAFAVSALFVALGELVVCAGAGYPLMLLIEHNGLDKRWGWNL